MADGLVLLLSIPAEAPGFAFGASCEDDEAYTTEKHIIRKLHRMVKQVIADFPANEICILVLIDLFIFELLNIKTYYPIKKKYNEII
jgi:hypothetical protein